MMEAMFYKSLDENKVECSLCPHMCKIYDGKRGVCGVRENRGGKLYSLFYGKPCSIAVDPIEKKPLFHFLPGSKSLSVATVGCNFRCEFCQNWQISQYSKSEAEIPGEEVGPGQLVELAFKNNCHSISYTYTEPTIFFEYAYDTAKLAHEKEIKNVFVTNGFISKKAIEKISKYLDAANIDLKSFSDDFYRKLCGGRLQPVLDAIRCYYENKVWVEITTLVIPGHNDSDKELMKIAEFIVSVDKKIPWHVSGFHGDYKMADTKATGVDVLHKAVEIGKNAGLKYVYCGNVQGDDFESTYCPGCGRKVVERSGYRILRINLKDSRCKFCGAGIEGVM